MLFHYVNINIILKRERLPLFGHSSQFGSDTPALQASQNHGSVEAELTVLDSLVTSETP